MRTGTLHTDQHKVTDPQTPTNADKKRSRSVAFAAPNRPSKSGGHCRGPTDIKRSGHTFGAAPPFWSVLASFSFLFSFEQAIFACSKGVGDCGFFWANRPLEATCSIILSTMRVSMPVSAGTARVVGGKRMALRAGGRARPLPQSPPKRVVG